MKIDDLSAAERTIIRLLAQGFCTKEIAVMRKCSTKTIDTQRANIFRKVRDETGNQELNLIQLLRHFYHFVEKDDGKISANIQRVFGSEADGILL